MPDFIKSSESLEHNQLGERESWCSGSPRRSLSLSGGAGWQSRGQGAGKEAGNFVHSIQPRAKPSPGNHVDGMEDRGGQGSCGWVEPEAGLWLQPDGSGADSGLPRTRGPGSVWPAGLQAKLFCPQGLGAGP